MSQSLQEQLIRAIHKRAGKHVSLIDEVSNILDISYDAAHRRLSMKSKFSIDETVLLAKHFHLSLDNTLLQGKHILVQKTKDIQTFSDLTQYIESTTGFLNEFKPEIDTSLYYSAKDIPLFYTIHDDILSKFKLYVWLYLLNLEGLNISFESFQQKSPLINNSKKLNDFYSSIRVHEIWNDTTTHSTLQQMWYFFQSDLLATETALTLCDNLKELIFLLEEKCTPKNEQYQLYYHDLLILNNNVLINDLHKKSLFAPYMMLGYFITDDEGTCKTVADFFQHQLKNSKLLNTAGTRDKKMFFNKAYQKIDFYKNQITSFHDML